MLVNLNDILPSAKKNGYAVGLFNTCDTDMLQAAIEAAEELRSPIILGTAEILLPYGELELIAPSVISAAKRASVPVVVHFDHGLTFERCIEALKLGFSSVMYDGSTLTYDQNVANTREIVKIAKAMGASVEGEIGHVGQASTSDNLIEDMYTTCREAIDFTQRTGVDALAVAIGSAHGVYKSKPKLNLKRLAEISAAVETPLVLHGGSGLSDDDFKNTIKNGISKINIFTDLCIAGADAVLKETDYLEMRSRKVEAIKQAVKTKILTFGSNGRV